MPPEILAVIPARAGSKSVPHKNIRPIAGKPLMAHSIAHALACPLITRSIVSTDSADYAELARDFGAETPFLRPDHISGDFATDLELFAHALDWLASHENYRPDLIVHLRPTHPVREIADLTGMIERLLATPEADSIRSIVKAPETPYKMWLTDENGRLRPVAECGIPEAYNMPRQKLPPVYLHNGCIDVVRTATILDKHSMTGETILGYEMKVHYDIDTEEQFREAEMALIMQQLENAQPQRFCFDVDGVVATTVQGLDYTGAGPRPDMIAIVNRLYDMGHDITLFTARGTVTGMDWREVTERQFADWGLKYHRLEFGKPAAEFYIDDRMLSMDALKRFFNPT